MQPVPLSFFVDFMLMAGTGRIHAARALKKTGETHRPVLTTDLDALVKAEAGVLVSLYEAVRV